MLTLKMNEDCVVHYSVWCAARFGIVGRDCLHTNTHTHTHTASMLSLPGRMPLVQAGAVGSTRPQAAASTRSEQWVGWRSVGPWTHWHCSSSLFFSPPSVTVRAYVCVRACVSQTLMKCNRTEIVDAQKRAWVAVVKLQKSLRLVWSGVRPVCLCLNSGNCRGMLLVWVSTEEARPALCEVRLCWMWEWEEMSKKGLQWHSGDARCLPLSCFTSDSPKRWLYSLPWKPNSFSSAEATTSTSMKRITPLSVRQVTCSPVLLSDFCSSLHPPSPTSPRKRAAHLIVGRTTLCQRRCYFRSGKVIAPAAEAGQREVVENFPRDAALGVQIIWTLTQFVVGLFKCFLSQLYVFVWMREQRCRVVGGGGGGGIHFVCPSF